MNPSTNIYYAEGMMTGDFIYSILQSPMFQAFASVFIFGLGICVDFRPMSWRHFLGLTRPKLYTQDDLDSLGGVRLVGTSDRDAEWSCAICLGNAADHEKIRELQFCKHAFHQECIDNWFLGSLSDLSRNCPGSATGHLSSLVCPLCRGEVFRPSSTNAATEEAPDCTIS